jgi:DNA primase
VGKIPDSIIDDIKSRLPVSEVVGRRVALKRAGREWRGLSPFKTERTPSFFVNDQKSMWHDFSTGLGGDIFEFVMRTEGLNFREAAEQLAEMAGVDLPKDEPASEAQKIVLEQTDRMRALLSDASAWYQSQLKAHAGAACLNYLREKRGLSDETIAAFSIGYAPKSNGNDALKDYLLSRKHTVADAVTSGMLIRVDDKPEYDRFRNRAMFPIVDAKSRVIGFGGRALEKDQIPKYLNSPSSPLFDKSNTLYNFAKARQPTYDTKRLIITEGYMDVVGLANGGFNECVATLGTAVTEEHLKQAWKVCAEPIVMLDGDTAGQKAALRALDIGLPLLEPDKTLVFAFAPEGQDPDDMIRQGGKTAVENVLSATVPFAEMLWRRETMLPADTPERRSAMERVATTSSSSPKNWPKCLARISCLGRNLANPKRKPPSRRAKLHSARHRQTKANSSSPSALVRAFDRRHPPPLQVSPRKPALEAVACNYPGARSHLSCA